MTMSSKGWENDKMEWAGKAKMMGQEADAKETVERKSPKEVHLTGAVGSPGGSLDPEQA